jgi:hypothetical protein
VVIEGWPMVLSTVYWFDADIWYMYDSVAR